MAAAEKKPTDGEVRVNWVEDVIRPTFYQKLDGKKEEDPKEIGASVLLARQMASTAGSPDQTIARMIEIIEKLQEEQCLNPATFRPVISTLRHARAIADDADAPKDKFLDICANFLAGRTITLVHTQGEEGFSINNALNPGDAPAVDQMRAIAYNASHDQENTVALACGVVEHLVLTGQVDREPAECLKQHLKKHFQPVSWGWGVAYQASSMAQNLATRMIFGSADGASLAKAIWQIGSVAMGLLVLFGIDWNMSSNFVGQQNLVYWGFMVAGIMYMSLSSDDQRNNALAQVLGVHVIIQCARFFYPELLVRVMDAFGPQGLTPTALVMWIGSKAIESKRTPVQLLLNEKDTYTPQA